MMPLTFKVLGSMRFTDQAPRIVAGLESLDAIAAPQNPDLIYSNDSGGYDEAIALKKATPSAKLILNVLDICEPCMPNVDMMKLYGQLSQADAVTVISPYVQSQLHRYFGLASYVIWNPIKDVTPAKRLSGVKPYPQFKAMMVGRLSDSGKRAALGIQGLIHAGFNEHEVAMVGSEFPSWGTRMGVITDDALNDLYNSVDYVVFPSLFEGLGLPLAESLVCGAVPVFCHDLSTLPDFNLPRSWACYPSVYSIASRLKSLQANPEYREKERELALQIGEGIVEKLSGKAVAQNIVNVYRKLSE